MSSQSTMEGLMESRDFHWSNTSDQDPRPSPGSLTSILDTRGGGVRACDKGRIKNWYDKNKAEARWKDGRLINDRKHRTKLSPPRQKKGKEITW